MDCMQTRRFLSSAKRNEMPGHNKSITTQEHIAIMRRRPVESASRYSTSPHTVSPLRQGCDCSHHTSIARSPSARWTGVDGVSKAHPMSFPLRRTEMYYGVPGHTYTCTRISTLLSFSRRDRDVHLAHFFSTQTQPNI